jgi:hypothetical protein
MRNSGVSDATTRRAREQLGVTWSRLGFGPCSHIVLQLDDEHPVVKRLRAQDLDAVVDRLCHGDDGLSPFAD